MAFVRDMPAQRDIGAAKVVFSPANLVRVEWALALLAFVALALSQIYGFVPIVFFIAATAALVGLRPQDAARDVALFWPLLVLPLFALLSAAWSDAPERTVRAGLQLVLTLAAAVVICRRIAPSQLVLIGFLALGIACLIPLPAMAQQGFMGAVTSTFGSKNAFSAYAVALIGFATALVVGPRHHLALRLFALAAIALSAFGIANSNSAGGKASAVIFAVLFVPLAAMTRFGLRTRVVLLGMATALLVTSAFFISDLAIWWDEVRQDVLNRDATLTGRTVLWQFAEGLTAKKPLLGYGYYAFWRVGNLDAEGLWRYFGIAGRSGFNFHNTLVEMRVDLGLAGVVLTLTTAAGVLAVAAARMVRSPSIALAAFLAMTVVLFVRCTAESGLISPFYPLTLIWVGAVVYAMRPEQRTDSPQRRAAGAPHLRRTYIWGGVRKARDAARSSQRR